MVVNSVVHGKIAIMTPARSINTPFGAKEKQLDNTKCGWGCRGKENFHSVDSGRSTGAQRLKNNLALPPRTEEPGCPCLGYIPNWTKWMIWTKNCIEYIHWQVYFSILNMGMTQRSTIMERNSRYIQHSVIFVRDYGTHRCLRGVTFKGSRVPHILFLAFRKS